jgi:hypothetical protein
MSSSGLWIDIVFPLVFVGVTLAVLNQCSWHSGGYEITDETTGKTYSVERYQRGGLYSGENCVTFAYAGKDKVLCDRYSVKAVGR